MPGTETGPRKKAPKKIEDPLDPIESKWKYMCIRSDVHARLDLQRKRKAAEVGFKLSWTKFFTILADGLERSVPPKVAKA